MTAQINLWRGEHAGFRRLLDLFEAQIGLFHAGARPNYGLMLDIVSYLRHYPDRFHHPKENAAISRLLRRDPRGSVLLRRLTGDHEVIARSGKQLLEQLEAIAAGALMSREAVEASAATYAAYYRQHLAREERELFPRAERLLDEHDWAAVEAAVPAGRDPLFGERVEERYRELHRQIALEGGCGCATGDLPAPPGGGVAAGEPRALGTAEGALRHPASDRVSRAQSISSA
ncbi:MAG TPA: hemerythrin domain-containing protein [Burkholderiales bacterium]|nr:hemerythrin domain-containing protein [Burkholderiales bacterium]